MAGRVTKVAGRCSTRGSVGRSRTSSENHRQGLSTPTQRSVPEPACSLWEHLPSGGPALLHLAVVRRRWLGPARRLKGAPCQAPSAILSSTFLTLFGNSLRRNIVFASVFVRTRSVYLPGCTRVKTEGEEKTRAQRGVRIPSSGWKN